MTVKFIASITIMFHIFNSYSFNLGGYDGNEFLSSVERYNIEQDEWQEETVLSSGRSGHGVAVGNKPFVKVSGDTDTYL